MRKAVYAGIIAVLFCLPLYSCSTTYSVYSKDIFIGKQLLKEKEYIEAEKHFQEAALKIRDSAPLTFMAIAEHKMGNLENAVKLIEEAAEEKPDLFYQLRTFGYRAIIYMKQDKAAGMAALKDYIDRYEHTYYLDTIKDLRKMANSGNVDEARMENIIDEQITWYENEMEEYLANNVGFIADRQRMFFIE
jgi:tetratricopeptide (TPR) repeat protein